MASDSAVERVKVAMLVALARHNVPPDTQDLLVGGNPRLGIAPNALGVAAQAAIDEMNKINEDKPLHCPGCDGDHL